MTPLQRACELQACFNLLAAHWAPDDTFWLRKFCSELNRRALHGLVGRYLQVHPERRIL